MQRSKGKASQMEKRSRWTELNVSEEQAVSVATAWWAEGMVMQDEMRECGGSQCC